jgi:hypothetical protein
MSAGLSRQLCKLTIRLVQVCRPTWVSPTCWAGQLSSPSLPPPLLSSSPAGQPSLSNSMYNNYLKMKTGIQWKEKNTDKLDELDLWPDTMG